MRSEDEFGTILIGSLAPLGLALAVWALTLPAPVVKSAVLAPPRAEASMAKVEPPKTPPAVPPAAEAIVQPPTATAAVATAAKPRRNSKVSRTPERVATVQNKDQPRTDCTDVPYQCRKWSEEWTLSSEALKKYGASTDGSFESE